MKFITSISALFLTSFVASADVYKIGGFTFDDNNAVKKAVVVEGPATIRDFSSGGFARFSDEYIDAPGNRVNLFRDFKHKSSIGQLMGRSSASGLSRHITLPQVDDALPRANVHRTTIELTWGDYGLPNQAGPDFVIFEVGSWEGFSVSVRKVGANDFTAARYQFPSNVDKRHNVNAVAFDLKDFGIADGEVISAIRIRNLFSAQGRGGADKVDNESGQGKVVYPTDPNYKNAFPLLTKEKGPEFKAEELGADIVYAVGLHDIVPLKNDSARASK